MLNAILNGALGETSSRTGSSSTSRSGTSSANNGKTLYTLPDGKSYSLTKDQFDEFNKVYNKAYGIAYSMKSAAPRVSDVLKYGYAVLDSYERGMVFVESDYLAMMGAKQQQHEQQTNTSAAVSNPNDFETLTLPDHTTVTVPKSEAKALKEFMQIYDLCMEYAYPKLASPKWSDVVKYGNVVLDWYRQGIPFDAAEYERRVMAGESAVPQANATYRVVAPDNTVYDGLTQEQYDVLKAKVDLYYYAFNDALRNSIPLSTVKWSDFLAIPDWQALELKAERLDKEDGKLTTTPPEVKIPDSVVPTVSVAPSEEKGSSLLVPGIILALGVIGAIALTSKSKKRR
jgi:hypothetical protein